MTPRKTTLGRSDLHSIGTEASIARVLKMPDGTTNVLVQGQRRVIIGQIDVGEDAIYAAATPVTELIEKTIALEAMMRAILALFEKCVGLSHSLGEEVYVAAMNADEPVWLADVVGSSLELKTAQHQEILEILNPTTNGEGQRFVGPRARRARA